MITAIDKFKNYICKKSLRNNISFIISSGISLAFVLSHIYGIGLAPISPGIIRPLHLMFLGLTFFMNRSIKAKNNKAIFDFLLVLILVSSTIYILLDYQSWSLRSFYSASPLDLFFSTCSIILVIIFTQRTMGWPMPILTLAMFTYAFLGEYIPGFFGIIPIGFVGLMSRLYSVEEGLYGPIVGVSASYIFFFVFLGALMSKTGTGAYFINFATAVAGKAKGATARVACIASMLFGSISGSGAANVVATGTFTIPLMLKSGYPPYFASAVEAISSTGGQILPPVMASAAFIMAELTGIPYINIIVAAIIPALLYYTAVFVGLHLKTIQSNEVKELILDEDVDKKQIFVEIYKLAPLVIVIIVLIMGKSPLQAAIWAMIGAIITSLFSVDTILTPLRFIEATLLGTKNIVPIGFACVNAGIIVGLLNVTGLGIKLSATLLNLSMGNLFLMLLLTMVVIIILGMGLPVAAAYIIAAAVCAPVLTKAGIPLLAAHLFIIHFASLSGLTPPVAINAYTAAGISGANPIRTAFAAVRIIITAFIIPFFFIYHSPLLLEGTIIELITQIPLAIFGVIVIVIAFGSNNRWFVIPARLAFFIAGLMLIGPNLYLGFFAIFIVIVTCFIINYRSKKCPNERGLPWQ